MAKTFVDVLDRTLTFLGKCTRSVGGKKLTEKTTLKGLIPISDAVKGAFKGVLGDIMYVARHAKQPNTLNQLRAQDLANIFGHMARILDPLVISAQRHSTETMTQLITNAASLPGFSLGAKLIQDPSAFQHASRRKAGRPDYNNALEIDPTMITNGTVVITPKGGKGRNSQMQATLAVAMCHGVHVDIKAVYGKTYANDRALNGLSSPTAKAMAQLKEKGQFDVAQLNGSDSLQAFLPNIRLSRDLKAATIAYLLINQHLPHNFDTLKPKAQQQRLKRAQDDAEHLVAEMFNSEDASLIAKKIGVKNTAAFEALWPTYATTSIKTDDVDETTKTHIIAHRLLMEHMPADFCPGNSSHLSWQEMQTIHRARTKAAIRIRGIFAPKEAKAILHVLNGSGSARLVPKEVQTIIAHFASLLHTDGQQTVAFFEKLGTHIGAYATQNPNAPLWKITRSASGQKTAVQLSKPFCEHLCITLFSMLDDPLVASLIREGLSAGDQLFEGNTAASESDLSPHAHSIHQLICHIAAMGQRTLLETLHAQEGEWLSIEELKGCFQSKGFKQQIKAQLPGMLKAIHEHPSCLTFIGGLAQFAQSRPALITKLATWLKQPDDEAGNQRIDALFAMASGIMKQPQFSAIFQAIPDIVGHKAVGQWIATMGQEAPTTDAERKQRHFTQIDIMRSLLASTDLQRMLASTLGALHSTLAPVDGQAFSKHPVAQLWQRIVRPQLEQAITRAERPQPMLIATLGLEEDNLQAICQLGHRLLGPEQLPQLMEHGLRLLQSDAVSQVINKIQSIEGQPTGKEWAFLGANLLRESSAGTLIQTLLPMAQDILPPADGDAEAFANHPTVKLWHKMAPATIKRRVDADAFRALCQMGHTLLREDQLPFIVKNVLQLMKDDAVTVLLDKIEQEEPISQVDYLRLLQSLSHNDALGTIVQSLLSMPDAILPSSDADDATFSTHPTIVLFDKLAPQTLKRRFDHATLRAACRLIHGINTTQLIRHGFSLLQSDTVSRIIDTMEIANGQLTGKEWAFLGANLLRESSTGTLIQTLLPMVQDILPPVDGDAEAFANHPTVKLWHKMAPAAIKRRVDADAFRALCQMGHTLLREDQLPFIVENVLQLMKDDAITVLLDKIEQDKPISQVDYLRLLQSLSHNDALGTIVQSLLSMPDAILPSGDADDATFSTHPTIVLFDKLAPQALKRRFDHATLRAACRLIHGLNATQLPAVIAQIMTLLQDEALTQWMDALEGDPTPLDYLHLAKSLSRQGKDALGHILSSLMAALPAADDENFDEHPIVKLWDKLAPDGFKAHIDLQAIARIADELTGDDLHKTREAMGGLMVKGIELAHQLFHDDRDIAQQLLAMVQQEEAEDDEDDALDMGRPPISAAAATEAEEEDRPEPSVVNLAIARHAGSVLAFAKQAVRTLRTLPKDRCRAWIANNRFITKPLVSMVRTKLPLDAKAEAIAVPGLINAWVDHLPTISILIDILTPTLLVKMRLMRFDQDEESTQARLANLGFLLLVLLNVLIMLPVIVPLLLVMAKPLGDTMRLVRIIKKPTQSRTKVAQGDKEKPNPPVHKRERGKSVRLRTPSSKTSPKSKRHKSNPVR